MRSWDIPERGVWRGVVVIAVAITSVWLAAAQGTAAQVPLPGRPVQDGQQAERAAGETVLDLAKQRATAEEKLKRLREDLARGEGRAALVPPGIGPDEVERARRGPVLLAQLYQGQLEVLRQIEKWRKAREAAEIAEKSWAGFTERPPYSILLLDDIRQTVNNYRDSLDVRMSSRAGVASQTEIFRERSQRAQEAMRLAAERFDGATPGSDAQAAARWRLDLARVEVDLAAAVFALSSMTLMEQDERLAASRAEVRLAERKRAALVGKVKITRDDVEEVRRRLETARAERSKQLEAVSAATERRGRERDQALRAVEKLRAAKPAAKELAEHRRLLALAEARLRAADTWMQSLGLQARTLTVFTTLYHTMLLNAWDWRLEVMTGSDADARQRAQKQIAEVISFFTTWKKAGSVALSEVRADLREQDRRTQYTSDPALEKYEREALAAMQQLEALLDTQQVVLQARIERLGEWSKDFSEVLKERSLGEIAGEIAARIRVAASAFWNYELLTIEDTVEVGGQKVTTTRGITVGKSIGAILLFLIGYRLMRVFSSRMERLLVRRFRFGEQQSRTVRRWADALGLVVLLMLTLNLARIPIAVFAFAGGALAIGIGFGTQTLIKNLISGMILLVERQVKVGDIVEVEGVTGTVTEVNIRSSTVRGFDGVESIVPNAILLEQKVTNWTLSNKEVRRVIKVGVAYGSPVRQVADVLADCAGRHGLVLKNPAPRVIFEDFGDSALVFALYFWVDLGPDTNSLQVMSDLRFMIEKQLAEAGIVIPYPQRDVHLDGGSPLRVALVREPDAAG